MRSLRTLCICNYIIKYVILGFVIVNIIVAYIYIYLKKEKASTIGKVKFIKT